MGYLASDLRSMGFSPTGQQSPFDEAGTLWSNGYELVCDETAIVIEGGGSKVKGEDESEWFHRNRGRFTYPSSGSVKMIGGFLSSYEWGEDEKGRFIYDSRRD